MRLAALLAALTLAAPSGALAQAGGLAAQAAGQDAPGSALTGHGAPDAPSTAPGGDLALEADDPALVEGDEALAPEGAADAVPPGAAQGRMPTLAAGAGAPDPAAPAVDAATLADLRAQLRAVSADLQGLRAQLKAGGAPAYRAAGGDKAIDRMNAIEGELSRLSGESERLRRRVEQVVRDGTNRVGDIEFRLCELEPGCDLAALTTPSLGAQTGAAPAGQGARAPAADEDTMTADERRDLGAAQQAMDARDYARAAQLFGDYAERHAGGARVDEVLYQRGAALEAAGDLNGATAAWLDSFSAAPAGPRAADALLGLSRTASGQTPDEACLYLGELTARFPASPRAVEARRRAAAAKCAAADAASGSDAPASAPVPSAAPGNGG